MTEENEKKQKNEFVEFDATYTGDFLGNTLGGIKKGFRYLGFATLGVGLDTEKANWWKGGYFYINGGNTHGGTPTEELIGDFQTASNIEAGNHTFLRELWFRQQVWNLTFTVGLQDLNSNYAVCDYAGNYINSSFGIHSVISSNICAPIFPITGLGLNIRWDMNDQVAWQVAVYDGEPIDFEKNPYNIRWQLNAEKGYLAITEFHYTPTVGEDLAGAYKIGTYYHTGEHTYGIFGTLEQTFWKKEERTLEAFVQAAFTPKKVHENYLHIGAGINLNGLFSKERPDMIGIGVASAFLNNNHTNETTIELTYKYQVIDQLFIQPDIQYVINPAGGEEKLENALVAMVRVGFEF
jgi:porin